MKISLLQQDIVWADPESNRRHLDGLLDPFVKGSVDLLVLPEMFSTGFITFQSENAEVIPCKTLDWMKDKAATLDCAIAGSLAVRENGLCYNRFFFVKPDGEVTTYDKRHLFAYGGEDKTFCAGDKRVVVEWRGLRLLLAVCYDLRFPIWLRNRGDYDGMLLVANWPDKRRIAWDVLIRARAIENQCFVAAVNRVGKDVVCEYDGGTAFINPYGEVVAAAADDREEIINIEYDMALQMDYHSKFPVLKDADNFELI